MTRPRTIVAAVAACSMLLVLMSAFLPSLGYAGVLTLITDTARPTATPQPTATPYSGYGSPGVVPTTPIPTLSSPIPTSAPMATLPKPGPVAIGATLSPLESLPQGALSREEAADIVYSRTFGSKYIAGARQDYPAQVDSALYTTTANPSGPAAERLPVWVVTIPGWGVGPVVPLGISDADQYSYHVETVAIIDALTGADVTGWGHGWAEPK